MKRSTYINGIKSILSDSTKFSMPTNNLTIKSIENKVCDLIKEMENNGIISLQQAWKLKPRGSNYPRLYGLPKIHKLNPSQPVPTDIPQRPILSMIQSPYHALAKWLVGILTPIREQLCNYNVKN